jgi:uncharacterized protein YcbX
VPVVSRFSTTPVKGTALHAPDRIALTASGVETNRRFHLVDDRGRLFNGKHHGPLVRIAAAYDEQAGRLSLQVPGHGPVEGTATALGEAVVTSFYGRDVPGRRVEGPFAAALTAFVGRPVHLVATDVPGAGADVHPVTLISAATVEHLRRGTPGGDALDARRFRMLVEVDGCAAFEEDTWAGRRLRLGGATVRVVGPVPRCVVTNENPDSGEVDFSTLKAIVRARGERAGALGTPVDHLPDGGAAVLGVYATVEEPGPVAVGDPVAPLDGGAAAGR